MEESLSISAEFSLPNRGSVFDLKRIKRGASQCSSVYCFLTITFIMLIIIINKEYFL